MSNRQRTTIYRGTVINLGLETAVLPNGEQLTLEIVRHPGGAVILAFDNRDYICLLRQFRYAVGGWIWELPAGVIDSSDENPLETARRELREEAGLEADDWVALPPILPTPGFCNEELFLYVARTLRDIGAHPNNDEHIEVHWKPLAEVMAMAIDGHIRDAKTIVALFHTIHAND